MNKFLTIAMALAMSTLMFSCLQEKETDYEKQVKRDDQILADYITQNGIEAEQTSAGYYYTRDVDIEDGVKFNDEDIIGIYYEMETLEGAFIESYDEADGEPIKFKYDREAQTLAPIAINSAVALAEEGETLTLYIPSYMAYSGYSYGQLISPYENLKVTVTFVKIYPVQEIAAIEDDKIQEYISQNELEGYEAIGEGIYRRIVEEGDTDSDASKNGNQVGFTYQLFQLGEEDPFSEVASNPVVTTLGASDNFDFINEGLKDLYDGAEIEVIAPSSAAYSATAQVLPRAIRQDYFDKGYLNTIVEPFEPILFKATIEGIQ
ncbi:peptidylprolyl isomerase [Echinicola sp. 20G]|uniref:peptidylprolyl isomerase n=1 Tax=Echinicola sp. 20G TaxID=2781961 RepID=UPI001910EFF9|nr:peptidylprolyl isomerase [Echinicola sp. 20G]